MSELGKCPSCGGLLAHRSDLAFAWKSCLSCGRQFDEFPLPRAIITSEYAPPDKPVRRSPSQDGVTRNLKGRGK